MLDDAWPEHLEGLQIPGNFHKSRDVVPYSAWNVHEVVAYELQPSTQFKTKPLQHLRTYNFLLAASISINKVLISTRKLARTAMSTWSFWDVLRKNEKLISSLEFCWKIRCFLSCFNTITMILPCLTTAWPTDSNKVCKGAMLCLGLQDPLN